MRRSSAAGSGIGCCSASRFGGALWAKYFVVVLAAPYALFLLFDRQARRALATPGPWLALVVALIVAAPHVVWLFQTDFLPFAYASHRAAPLRGWFDHVLHPAVFAGEPDLLPAAVAVHRRGAVFAEARSALPVWRGCALPTPSTAAS